MSSTDLIDGADLPALGRDMYRLIAELYPLCRSITGNGLRQTLAAVGQHIPLVLREVPTGTAVFDWTVPKEWNVRDAYVKNSRGDRVIDFRRSNLHLVNYSVPVRRKMELRELKRHLFTLPDRPDWVPYKTSYYKESWGFCLTHHELLSLEDDEYEVCIDATLEDGHLTYGELLLSGEEPDEVLLSCHSCHPSLCNDNLSGIALTTYLARHLSTRSRRYSYRFLFIPGTIGAVTWLCLNEARARCIKHGLVVACVGDRGHLTYKRSRRGDAEIDRAAIHVLRHSAPDHEILDFSPYGYDERQYCSPGFNLAVGSLTRTPHGRFPQYHTSADDLSFVEPSALAGALEAYLQVLDVLENNKTYTNLNPCCEPQLGKRGLYERGNPDEDENKFEFAMLWVLNLSDGTQSLLDIAERSGLRFDIVLRAARVLREHALLEECRTTVDCDACASDVQHHPRTIHEGSADRTPRKESHGHRRFP